MKKVIIMRGLPGSGKSTWVTRRIIENKTSTCVVSADVYHYVQQPPREDGTLVPPKYEFKIENARVAHDGCLRDFLQAIKEGWQEIIVDNTNTTAWEIATYYRLAEVSGYTPEIVWIQAPLERCIQRGIHSVPAMTVRNMRERMERESLPPWWTRRIFVEQEDGYLKEYKPN